MRILTLAITAFALALGWAGPSRAEDWTVQRFPELGFASAFPAPATRTAKPVVTSGGEVPTDYVYAKVDNGTYFTSSSDISGHPEIMAQPADAAARGIIDGAGQGHEVLSAPVRITRPAPGWEATFKAEAVVMRVRTFVAGKRTFTDMVLAPSDHPERLTDASAERFFASFKIGP
jgi:hypothetical protein